MQIYTSEQIKYISATAEKYNSLYARGTDSALTREKLRYYEGMLAGMQIGKRKLYRVDVKTGLYIRAAAELSPAQAKFAEAFPGKAVDCDVPARIDVGKLIAALQKSAWLCKQDNITLASCIRLYDKIIAGEYNSSAAKQTGAGDFLKHDYTRPELDAMFYRAEAFEI